MSYGQVQRAKEGILPKNYKQQDYESLKKLADEKRSNYQQQLSKVKQLQTEALKGKEKQLLKEHKQVWHGEWKSLLIQYERAEGECFVFRHSKLGQLDQQMKEDILANVDELEFSIEEFKKDTIDPIWTLREDVDFRLASGEQVSGSAGHEIVATIRSVQDQQKEILHQLSKEEQALEDELERDGLCEGRLCGVETGTPHWLMMCETEQDDLKAALIEQFLLIDDHYLELLADLRQREKQLRANCSSDDMATRVAQIIDQHPGHLANRRTLYIDRLSRTFPNLSRLQLVKMEEVHQKRQFCERRRLDLSEQMRRSREEMASRAMALLVEAERTLKQGQERDKRRKMQENACRELHEQVWRMRERREEAWRIERELSEAGEQREKRARRRREEREENERARKREQIEEHHETLSRRKMEEERKSRRRLEELRKIAEQQAIKDRERVDYRGGKWKEKSEKRMEEAEQKKREEEEKENILEALRAKVRPKVESDLLRLWRDTKARREGRKERSEAVPGTEKPMFPIQTYNSEKISRDLRVQAELRLRDVGLHGTDYARELLRKVPAPSKPRPDMQSNFRIGQNPV